MNTIKALGLLVCGLVFTQSGYPEKLVNRRVLILDFANVQKSKAHKYLEITIPEAIVGPLVTTHKFEMMSRQISGLVGRKSLFNENKVISIGQKVGADVVVMGKFVVIGEAIEIQAKAIDLSKKKVSLSIVKKGKTDESLFTTIKEMADAMSKDMAEKLPPQPQRVVYRNRIVTRNTGSRDPVDQKLRTLVLPGWGHVNASQSRGWLYIGLWALSAGAFSYAHYDYTQKRNSYEVATSDFDAKYQSANEAQQFRAYASAGLFAVYLFAFADLLFFDGSASVVSGVPTDQDYAIRVDVGNETIISTQYSWRFP